MKRTLVLCFALAAGACASAQPETVTPAREVTPAPPAAVDPVGVFDFATTVEGMAVTGTLTVNRSAAGAYEGSIATNITETIPVRSVTVSGQRMDVVGDTPDGPISLVLEFRGDEFSGSWTTGAMSGTHSGKRRPR